MNSLALAIVLLILALAGVVVRKTYYYLPSLEMKRRAEKKDPTSARLFKAVAYGNSLSVLMWLYIGITSAAGFVLLSKHLNIWIALLVVAVLLWLSYSLIPSTRITTIGLKLTKFVTPFIAWILNYTFPLLGRSAEAIEGHYIAGAHTRIFERADLVDLIERQKFQDDNRLSEEELAIVLRALSFDEYKVRDILTSRKAVRTIQADDTIGPILIDELHKSGQEYVLVKENPKGLVTGTLAFNRLSIASKGQVRDVMDRTVYYLHENDSLREALHAFFVTNHEMFVVVDSHEDFVGILTIENVIRHLMGHLPGDDFDQYTDPTAVAARHPKPIPKSKAKESSVKTEEKMVE